MHAQELDQCIRKSTLDGFTVGPIGGDNLLAWEATIFGDEAGSPWAGGAFKLDILIPEHYPFKPPTVHFRTQMYHPNVGGGEVFLPMLQEWSPACTIFKGEPFALLRPLLPLRSRFSVVQ